MEGGGCLPALSPYLPKISLFANGKIIDSVDLIGVPTILMFKFLVSCL